MKERMSISLFNAVSPRGSAGAPEGAIEILTDTTGASHFKSADLRRFLEIVVVARNNNNIAIKSRSELSRPGHTSNVTQSGMRGGGKNPHDAFIDLKGALEIVVRSKKSKAVELTKWLTRKGVEKVVEEKDMQLALLSNDLLKSQEHTRQLEYTNTELQGEIRAKDQEICRRQEEVQNLIPNRHVPRRQGIDNVLCFVDKRSNEKHQFYVIRCQRKALEKNKRCLPSRYPDMVILGECDDANGVHRWCRFKRETIKDFHRNHFNLNEEGRELFETAFDIEM